jgi:nucleoside-diphosphate-sugar epimerase
MKIFVAGATGVLGKRAVRELVAAGHDVTGVARSEEKAALVRSLGATPANVDLFDPPAVKDAVAGHDVVCNLATHIPPTTKMAMPGAWDENNRIRSEASRNLVDAALAAGAKRYIQEAVCFLYGDHGLEWIDEDTPLDVPKKIGGSMLDAEANTRRFTEAGGVGVALRFGGFYGPDARQAQDFVRLARNHVAPMVGSKDGYMPMIHLDDTGTAVVAALKAPAGTYNVTDETITRRDQMDALARAVGVNHLVAAPEALTKVGPLSYIARSQRVSNKRFKDATGWQPRYPTVNEGWPAVVAEMGAAPPRVGLLARIGLLLLALTSLELGIWATLAPQSFFKSFPGGGRHWVAVDGPFNEHLVRDFGGYNLALALLLIVALVVGSRLLVTTAAGAYLLFAVPHFLYHLLNLQVYDTSDKVANVFSLALSVVIPIAVIVAAQRTSVASSSRKLVASP